VPDTGNDRATTVAAIMRQIEAEVRADRRARLVARGGPSEYADAELFAIVERVLRRAVEDRDHDVLLLEELAGQDPDWRLRLPLTFSSHRPIVGPIVVFLKRRVLAPMMRWLYEYSLENFRRQQRINRLLFACIEELAIENARLRKIAGVQEAGLQDDTDR
jgi:hypothetical protein